MAGDMEAPIGSGVRADASGPWSRAVGPFRYRYKVAILGLCALAAGFAAGWHAPVPTRLVFISVGQGDCAVFEKGGTAIMIDDGPGPPMSNADERIVVPRLRDLGVDSVAAILLSHSDEDHVGGTPAVLKAYPEAHVFMSDQFRNSSEMLHKLNGWGMDPSRIDWLPPEDTLSFGDFTASIECPPMTPGDDANNGSMFVHLHCRDASATFSGDAPASVEKAMEPLGDWRSEILKVGHHGSRTATDESWIEAVHPRYAVISVGRNNEYGHPNREVIDRLKRDGVETFRTDQVGDIEFDFDGRTFIKR